MEENERNGLLTTSESPHCRRAHRPSEEMACTSWVRDELEDHGWLVNQTRMWWASH